MKHIPDTKIKNAVPHIFARPFLFVEPNTSMLQIATFLAIGPQIYVDGLVVVSENDKGQRIEPVGRIGCKHITAGLGDINTIKYHNIDAIISMAPVESDITVSKAAELLMDICTPCLISEEGTDHYILSPWDIVMKTLTV